MLMMLILPTLAAAWLFDCRDSGPNIKIDFARDWRLPFRGQASIVEDNRNP